MPTFTILDSSGVTRYFEASGSGTIGDPYRSFVEVLNTVNVAGTVDADIVNTVDVNIVGGALSLATDKLGGKNVIVPAVTLTTSAVSYAVGQSVGGLIVIPNAARVAGGTGLIRTVTLYDKDKQNGEYDLLIFSTSPTGWTITNNALVVPGSAGASKLISAFSLSQSWVSVGIHGISSTRNLDIPFQLDSGVTNLYACLVARSTPALSSTTSLVLSMGIEQN